MPTCLIDAIVDDYLPLLDIISERMDDLEDSIFGEWRAEVIEEIFTIKKKLLYLRRSITPLRDVFNTMLRREQPIFPRETHVYFQDVFDHLIRVADTIDTLRDMLSSTMDAYLSVSGNRMNKIMKRLTSISTILMSVTLIAGIYGMNFDLHARIEMAFRLRLCAPFDGGSGCGAVRLLEEGEMDIKKLSSTCTREKGKKGDTAQLAAQLAPLEERSQAGRRKAGGDRFAFREWPGRSRTLGQSSSTKIQSHVPKDMMEGGDEKTFLGMEPVVLVILGVMLAFIAFIAWQITLMPAK